MVRWLRRRGGACLLFSLYGITIVLYYNNTLPSILARCCWFWLVRVPCCPIPISAKNLCSVPIGSVAQGRWIWSVLAWHHSPNGAPLNADHHHPTKMNTSTPFFSPVLPLQLTEEGINKLDEVCFEVTQKFFRKDYAERIMDALKYSRCAKKGYYRTTPDFRHFIGIYHWVKSHCNYDDYVVFRKYLQTLSAVYRWHFGHYQSVTVYNYLHERVKIETHCEHCGSLSKALIDRLIEENLWAV